MTDQKPWGSIRIPGSVYSDFQFRWEALALTRLQRKASQTPKGGRGLYVDVGVSRARAIELLLAHIELHPPTDEWVQEFEFRSRPIGRPRINKLDSPAHPPVSEDQPSDDESEEEDHGTPQFTPQFEEHPGTDPDPGLLYPR